MKRSFWRRTKIQLVILGGAGMLFASGELSCASFGASTALASANLCFLLNCNDGALGGLIDFCAPTSFISFVGGRQDPGNEPFLADCPQQ